MIGRTSVVLDCLRLAATLALLLTAGTAVGAAGWWFAPGEDFALWSSGLPPRRWATADRQEAKWREEGLQRRFAHTYVPLEHLSLDLQHAVLVSEDMGFFTHRGVDLAAVWEAVGEWRRGRPLRGASTVSQQLARILFLSSERTLHRKLAEARLAWWLERRLGKRRILELYVNVVEFGPGLYGAEAAAARYYGTTAADLDSTSAAGLVAAIPSPARDNPATATPRWEQRRGIILQRMGRAEWLRERLAALVPSPDAADSSR